MDAHIQSYLRGAASRARDTERVGPFLATFSRHSANPFLNYAIPDDGAIPSSDDVAALVAAYRRHERTPRLEYLPGVAAAVEAALVAGGFVVEGRLPLMVCAPGAERDMPMPPGIELVAPVSDDDLFAMMVAQNEAYGDPVAPSPAVVEGRKANLAAGGLAVVARDVATGEVVGGGQCDAPAEGVTELTSVGVRAAFRRRCIAGALAAWLVRGAFAAGAATVFLMAAHEAEARIYARVGFSATSEILHISLPRG